MDRSPIDADGLPNARRLLTPSRIFATLMSGHVFHTRCSRRQNTNVSLILLFNRFLVVFCALPVFIGMFFITCLHQHLPDEVYPVHPPFDWWL